MFAVGAGRHCSVLIPDQLDYFHRLRSELALEETCARTRDNRDHKELQSVEKFVPDQRANERGASVDSDGLPTL